MKRMVYIIMKTLQVLVRRDAVFVDLVPSIIIQLVDAGIMHWTHFQLCLFILYNI